MYLYSQKSLKLYWFPGRVAIYQNLPLGSKSSIFDKIWPIYLIWRFHFYLKYKEKRAAIDLLHKECHPPTPPPTNVDKRHINVSVPKTNFCHPSLSLFLTKLSSEMLLDFCKFLHRIFMLHFSSLRPCIRAA